MHDLGDGNNPRGELVTLCGDLHVKSVPGDVERFQGAQNKGGIPLLEDVLFHRQKKLSPDKVEILFEFTLQKLGLDHFPVGRHLVNQVRQALVLGSKRGSVGRGGEEKRVQGVPKAVIGGGHPVEGVKQRGEGVDFPLVSQAGKVHLGVVVQAQDRAIQLARSFLHLV